MWKGITDIMVVIGCTYSVVVRGGADLPKVLPPTQRELA